jgi:hypothetical protein
MKVTTFLVFALALPTKADDLRDGGGKSPKHGNDPKDKSPPKPNDYYDSKYDSNDKPNGYDDTKYVPNYKDDDGSYKDLDLSNFVSTSNTGSASTDNLYDGNDDDFTTTGYRASQYNSNNNGSTNRKTVDIIFRPYGSTCPRTINPGNLNSSSDKDFILVIFGTSDVNVKNIEPDVVGLSGVSRLKYVYPISWDVRDIGRPGASSSSSPCHCKTGSTDGISDLILRYKESAVAKIPEIAKAKTGDIVNLIVKGRTSSQQSYTFIKGKDCIEVV